MKLPKCPHCKRLLIGIVGRAIVVGDGPKREEPTAMYFCPETLKEETPEWVWVNVVGV